MESLKHKLSSSEAEEEDTLPVVKWTRRTADLPPELWELIFRNLNAYWLRTARLTCSSWNQIIRGSSRLMAKFVLSLTTQNFKEDRPFVRNLLATGGGYTRAEMALMRIGIHRPRDNWLKPLGTTLTSLTLQFSGTEVLLTRLLQELPNLKQLKLINRTRSFRSVVPDFRLDKLEELAINDPIPRMLSFFRMICPQLAALKLKHYIIYRPDVETAIFDLVKGTRRTLKELRINASRNVVDDLAGLEGLRLTRLAIDGTHDDILRFVKQQPDIEELDILWGISIPAFNGIISILPKLKKLSVRIADQKFQQTLSLQKLSSIESLSIRLGGVFYVTHHLLDLIDCNFANVRDLSLYRCRLSSQVMLDLQRTNVSKLTLKNCSLPRLSDLSLLKHLNYVELEDNKYLSESDESSCPSVRSLKVVDAPNSEQQVIARMFPNLERLEACGIACFCEEFFKVLSQHSPLLKELLFARECYFSIGEVIKHVPTLQTISIQCTKEERECYAEYVDDKSHNVAIEFY